MKTKVFTCIFSLAIIPAGPDAAASNGSLSYIIGGVIAILILAYLIYTLLRPEKF